MTSEGCSGTRASILLACGQPSSPQQLEAMMRRLRKDLQSWNEEISGCRLESLLSDVFTNRFAEVEASSGIEDERILTWQSSEIKVTVLLNTHKVSLSKHLSACVASSTSYRHVFYTGPVLKGSGDWVLVDNVFSFPDFAKIIRSSVNVEDVKSQAAVAADLHLRLSCNAEGQWSDVRMRHLNVHLNPGVTPHCTDDSSPFIECLTKHVDELSFKGLTPATCAVGCLDHKTKPVMYLLPAGSGTSAYFGIGDFNMLADGGFQRKSSFWGLIKRLQRLDLVLLSHFGVDNSFGVHSFLDQMISEHSTVPEIGAVFLNPGLKKLSQGSSDSEEKQEGDEMLKIDIVHESQLIFEKFLKAGLQPIDCVSPAGLTVQPIRLYNRVGYGSLDMYVLNPVQDSKEMKEFVKQWTSGSQNGTSVNSQVSVCALLVWKPSNENSKVTRILLPGSVSCAKVLDCLNKIKALEVLKDADTSSTGKNSVKKANLSNKPILNKVTAVTKGHTNGSKDSLTAAESSRAASKPTSATPVTQKAAETSAVKTAKVDSSKTVASAKSKTTSAPIASASKPVASKENKEGMNKSKEAPKAAPAARPKENVKPATQPVSTVKREKVEVKPKESDAASATAATKLAATKKTAAPAKVTSSVDSKQKPESKSPQKSSNAVNIVASTPKKAATKPTGAAAKPTANGKSDKIRKSLVNSNLPAIEKYAEALAKVVNKKEQEVPEDAKPLSTAQGQQQPLSEIGADASFGGIRLTAEDLGNPTAADIDHVPEIVEAEKQEKVEKTEQEMNFAGALHAADIQLDKVNEKEIDDYNEGTGICGKNLHDDVYDEDVPEPTVHHTSELNSDELRGVEEFDVRREALQEQDEDFFTEKDEEEAVLQSGVEERTSNTDHLSRQTTRDLYDDESQEFGAQGAVEKSFDKIEREEENMTHDDESESKEEEICEEIKHNELLNAPNQAENMFAEDSLQDQSEYNDELVKEDKTFEEKEQEEERSQFRSHHDDFPEDQDELVNVANSFKLQSALGREEVLNDDDDDDQEKGNAAVQMDKEVEIPARTNEEEDFENYTDEQKELEGVPDEKYREEEPDDRHHFKKELCDDDADILEADIAKQSHAQYDDVSEQADPRHFNDDEELDDFMTKEKEMQERQDEDFQKEEKEDHGRAEDEPLFDSRAEDKLESELVHQEDIPTQHHGVDKEESMNEGTTHQPFADEDKPVNEGIPIQHPGAEVEEPVKEECDEFVQQKLVNENFEEPVDFSREQKGTEFSAQKDTKPDFEDMLNKYEEGERGVPENVHHFDNDDFKDDDVTAAEEKNENKDETLTEKFDDEMKQDFKEQPHQDLDDQFVEKEQHREQEQIDNVVDKHEEIMDQYNDKHFNEDDDEAMMRPDDDFDDFTMKKSKPAEQDLIPHEDIEKSIEQPRSELKDEEPRDAEEGHLNLAEQTTKDDGIIDDHSANQGATARDRSHQDLNGNFHDGTISRDSLDETRAEEKCESGDFMSEDFDTIKRKDPGTSEAGKLECPPASMTDSLDDLAEPHDGNVRFDTEKLKNEFENLGSDINEFGDVMSKLTDDKDFLPEQDDNRFEADNDDLMGCDDFEGGEKEGGAGKGELQYDLDTLSTDSFEFEGGSETQQKDNMETAEHPEGKTDDQDVKPFTKDDMSDSQVVPEQGEFPDEIVTDVKQDLDVVRGEDSARERENVDDDMFNPFSSKEHHTEDDQRLQTSHKQPTHSENLFDDYEHEKNSEFPESHVTGDEFGSKMETDFEYGNENASNNAKLVDDLGSTDYMTEDFINQKFDDPFMTREHEEVEQHTLQSEMETKQKPDFESENFDDKNREAFKLDDDETDFLNEEHDVKATKNLLNFEQGFGAEDMSSADKMADKFEEIHDRDFNKPKTHEDAFSADEFLQQKPEEPKSDDLIMHQEQEDLSDSEVDPQQIIRSIHDSVQHEMKPGELGEFLGVNGKSGSADRNGLDLEDVGSGKVEPGYEESLSDAGTDDFSHRFDPLADWGHPSSLPMPDRDTSKTSAKSSATKTPNLSAAAKTNGKVPSSAGNTSSTKPLDKKATPLQKSTAADSSVMSKTKVTQQKQNGDTQNKKPATENLTKAKKTAINSTINNSGNTTQTKAPAASAGRARSTSKSPAYTIHVDLTYIPNSEDDANLVHLDFFRSVRARYYVLSCVEPDVQLLDALLLGKQAWNEPEVEVTLIPTYDSMTLRKWKNENSEDLEQLRIKIAPPATNCKIQFPDDDEFLAYKIEF